MELVHRHNPRVKYEFKVCKPYKLSKATVGSSGYDIASDQEEFVLEPGQIVKVNTGIRLEIPIDYEAQIRSRSGLGSRGIAVAQGVGTIDADYRGEIIVPLINHGFTPHRVSPGDRIAQLVFAEVGFPTVLVIDEVDELSDTQRGEGGFGSTGK